MLLKWNLCVRLLIIHSRVTAERAREEKRERERANGNNEKQKHTLNASKNNNNTHDAYKNVTNKRVNKTANNCETWWLCVHSTESIPFHTIPFVCFCVGCSRISRISCIMCSIDTLCSRYCRQSFTFWFRSIPFRFLWKTYVSYAISQSQFFHSLCVSFVRSFDFFFSIYK